MTQSFSPTDLVDLADRYCIQPDGDHELTWAIAVHDGLTPMSPDDFRGLRLPGARQLRGYTQTVDGIEIRVLTAQNRIRGGNAGTTFFKLCWVSADPMDRDDVDRAVQTYTGLSGFRQNRARAYAWVPEADGGRRTVSSREFQRRGQAIAREDGMRMILTNNVSDLAAITYMTEAQDCEDWCY